MRIEPLETRIAPAVFFLSGTALTVEDAAGNDAENLPSETAARTTTGATKAVLLQAGDLLVFDEDNDNVRDSQERVLVEVTAGRAMVFLSNGFGPTAGAFDENEISGLAVSDGFRGKVRTDVNGSVVTNLDAAGAFTSAVVQNGSIAELKVSGRVLGSVAAGKNISDVSIGDGLFTIAEEASAESIVTGTATAGTLAKFANGGASFVLTFAQPAAAPGGNISNVRLEHGAALVRAGNGANVLSGPGNGPAGGSITGLVMVDAPGAIEVFAGRGGFSQNGNGGTGGSIVDSSFVFEGDTTVLSQLRAGAGGSAPVGTGGAGGTVTRTTVHQFGDGLGLNVRGGSGGDASGSGGIGGAGGAIHDSTVITAGSSGDVNGTFVGGGVSVAAGGGGFGTVRGGAGGALSASRVQVLDSTATLGFLSVRSGQGGSSDEGSGSVGGAFKDSSVLVTAAIGRNVNGTNVGELDLVAGDGGDGFTAGGAGGAMSNNTVQILNGVTLANGEKFTITAGTGGSVEGNGTGGAGGASSDNRVRLGTVNLLTEISAGTGGTDATPADPGSGGKGGALTGLTLETIGTLAGLRVFAGDGGAAGTTGRGGAGGALSGLTTDLRDGVSDSLFISAGNGGAGGTVQGQGGSGGAFSASTIKVDDIAAAAFIRAGGAGVARGASSFAGGAMTGVVFENIGLIDTLNIRAGAGGDIVSGTGVTGGNGALDGLTITNAGGANAIRVGGGDQAAHGGTGNGGNQGIVKNVTIRNLAALDTLDIVGNDGGFAGSGGGNGGSGGGVSKITVEAPAAITGGVTIEAGRGGDGRGANSVGGVGGAVAEIALNGPNTRFTIESGDGGKGAAQGGKGGAVSVVSGSIREVNLFSGDGGAATTGTGGAGGKIDKLDFRRVGDFVRRIVAGDGGDGATLGGVGGSINDVLVIGDIGDFDASFGVGDTAMGGIFAGQAGLGASAQNGSVSKINATRIAAIAAGTPAANALTAANAVHSLTEITAFIVGADVAADGDFDFTNAGIAGFALGQGDTALDGLVIARLESQIHALPVRPLFSAALVAAPAPTGTLSGTFFLSATALTVEDAAGNDAQNTAAENAAQTSAGSTRAIFLQAGQSLVFDENDNNRRDPQERVLVSVSGGSAIIFLSDGFGPTPGAFDENEISGLAVSHEFKGTIRTDVNGSITTTLDSSGNFTPTVLQRSAISQLTVAGRVAGEIGTGRGMTELKIGGGLFTPAAELSVNSLRTGSAVDVAVRYSFSGPALLPAFTQPAGTGAGSIAKVRLDNGAALIETGNGGAVTSGSSNGGAGGSISEVVMSDAEDPPEVRTGSGGGAASGRGGAGGSMTKSTFVFGSSADGFTPSAFFLTGPGGVARNGGAGGAITTTTMHALDGLRTIFVRTGDGAPSGNAAAAGGAGGAISGSTIIVAGGVGQVLGGVLTGGTISIEAGDGGSGASGGVGGAITGTRVQALGSEDAIAFLALESGAGGTAFAGNGAAGGAFSGNTVQIHTEIGIDSNSTLDGSVRIRAGAGGSAPGTGGAGGAFGTSVIDLPGSTSIDGEFLLAAGAGGLTTGTGTGGKGGNFSNNTVRLGEVSVQSVEVRAGAGGNDSTSDTNGTGGAGGALSTLRLDTYGAVGDVLFIGAGDGGGGGGTGDGGAGGALSDVTLVAVGELDDLSIRAGDGNAPGSVAGAGGAGGSLARVSVKVGLVDEDIDIRAGVAAFSVNRNARNGGNLSDVSVQNAGPVEEIGITAGTANVAASGTGDGGSSGSLARVSVTNLGGVLQIEIGKSFFFLGSSAAGDGFRGAALSEVSIANFSDADSVKIAGTPGGRAGSGGGDDGNGGAVSKIVITDRVGIDSGVEIRAPLVNSVLTPGTERGGASGNIDDVLLNGPRTTFTIRTFDGSDGTTSGGHGGSISNVRGVVGQLVIQAGDGGDGTNPGASGGIGGSVSDIAVTGVSDFVRAIIAGNGGAGVTLGGAGGSIDDVTVVGDIGDFDANFGVSAMGGLFAGQAGAGGAAQNGSVTDVSARRIAAIIAGHPLASAITSANGVFNLTGISAQIFGADVNANGAFNFTNAGLAGFHLGDGDTALDGLIIARRAAHLAALSVTPLQSFSLVP